MNPRLELTHPPITSPCPLRKNQNRTPRLQYLSQPLNRIVLPCDPLPRYQHRLKQPARHLQSKRRLPPVVLRCRWRKILPSLIRQRRPHHRKIQMTRVIRKINRRLTPTRRTGNSPHTADQSRYRSHQRTNHFTTPFARSCNARDKPFNRRHNVTKIPVTIKTNAHSTTLNPALQTHPRPAHVAIKTHAHVTNAIRCGFAIGPRKSCAPVSDAPCILTHAVINAPHAATHPSPPDKAVPPAIPKPARINVSASRSGNSLYKSPLGDFSPPSTASIPSIKLHTNRICTHNAAPNQAHTLGTPKLKHAAAPAANTTLMTDT